MTSIPDLFTLGMFILDDIHFPAPREPQYNILGGAGLFAALGARLVSSTKQDSRKIEWIVHCGSDFPAEGRRVIESWETGCALTDTPDRLTTRSWNGYGPGDHRDFRYLTPKIRIDHTSLTPSQIQSRSFHLVCSASRCIDLVTNILTLRHSISTQQPTHLNKPTRPIFVWEPIPDLCIESEFETVRLASQMVDIISPNHEEIATLFGQPAAQISAIATDPTDVSNVRVEIDKQTVERQASRLLDMASCPELSTKFVFPDGTEMGVPQSHSVVIRASKAGSYITSSHNIHSSLTSVETTAKPDSGSSRWLPAYYDPNDSTSHSKIVDPTGAGNTFLGALAITLSRGDSLEWAAAKATVAASFVIEQVGVPILTDRADQPCSSESESGDDKLWNGDSVQRRLTEYVGRLKLDCAGSHTLD